MISHNTDNIAMLNKQLSMFKEMLETRKFLHWYTGEGMDMVEFEEAQYTIEQLLLEYREKISRL